MIEKGEPADQVPHLEGQVLDISTSANALENTGGHSV